MFKITKMSFNPTMILVLIFALILGFTGTVGWWTIALIAAVEGFSTK